jgi:hypothetical protein
MAMFVDHSDSSPSNCIKPLPVPAVETRPVIVDPEFSSCDAWVRVTVPPSAALTDCAAAIDEVEFCCPQLAAGEPVVAAVQTKRAFAIIAPR